MITTEITPNPNSLKFLSRKLYRKLDRKNFKKKDLENIRNPFIKDLLNFEGVELVLLSKNFLSVKKNDKTSWDSLKPTVISHINDYFQNNKGPILANNSERESDNDSQTVKKLKKSLTQKLDLRLQGMVGILNLNLLKMVSC